MAVAYDEVNKTPMMFIGTVKGESRNKLYVQEVSKGIDVICNKGEVTPLYSNLVYLVEGRQIEGEDIKYIRTVLCAMTIEFITEQLGLEGQNVDRNKMKQYMTEMSELNHAIPDDVNKNELGVCTGVEFLEKFVVPYMDLNDYNPNEELQDRNTNKSLN
ncbi:hypothetical protein ACQUY5_29350 [Bacillus cereus]|uniref:hypothetical protein n=1 Tax=Bacillus cereus TaxID=1396 RepID=UPI003D181179